MKIEQIYTGCMSHAAYYLESNGEAAIFDPLREVQPYIERAKTDNAKIKYVFETHFHADFVSGHLDLAKKTGAEIVYGPTAKPGFDAIIAEDDQEFHIGKCIIRAIHTPGHTMESTTYMIIDEKGKEHGLITGDTLFIGDVGRPDLAQHLISDLTQEKLAGYLYDSLRKKIMPLNDKLIVYPNHGAGSACGKNMSKETTDTLGHQKLTNYALRPDMTKEEFIREVLTGLTNPPGYFPKNVLMNIQGYESLDTILEKSKKALKVEEFEFIHRESGAIILDTRDPQKFSEGFIPDSINIGLDGNFAMWVGELISDIKQEILLITDKDREEEAIIRLSRVGYDHVVGYLKNGFEAWKREKKEIQTVNRITAYRFSQTSLKNAVVFDIRKRSEYESEHVIGAVNIPLNELTKHFSEIPKDQPFILYCAGGYRSMIAASILKANGWNDFVDVKGGMNAISKTSVELTEYKCPTTML